MFKRIALLLTLCVGMAAHAASTSLSGIAFDNNNAPITNGTIVFALQNCGATPSAPWITQQSTNANGLLTGTLTPNYAAGCTGGSYYAVSAFNASGQLVWVRNYQINTASWNVSTAARLIVLPAQVVGPASPTITSLNQIPGLVDSNNHLNASLLPPSGVTAGACPKVVVDATGRVVSCTTLAIADVTGLASQLGAYVSTSSPLVQVFKGPIGSPRSMLQTDPVNPMDAATKEYVDNSVQTVAAAAASNGANAANAVQRTGDTLTGPLTGPSIAGSTNCDVFTGSDFAGQLHACLMTLSSVGGPVNSRNLQGTQHWASNAFLGLVATGGHFQLGSSAIYVTHQFVLPHNWMVEGVGRGGTSVNTDIIADPSFQTACQITSQTLTSNVVTLVTAEACNLDQDDSITEWGQGAPFDGGHIIASVIDNQHFTYKLVAADTSLSGGWLQIPIFSVGNFTNSAGTKALRFSIDGNNLAGSICVYSDNIQELSGVEDISVRNCRMGMYWEKGTGHDGQSSNVANADITHVEVVWLGNNVDQTAVTLARSSATGMVTATFPSAVSLYPGNVVYVKGASDPTFEGPWVITVGGRNVTTVQWAQAGADASGVTLSQFSDGYGVRWREGGSFARGISGITVDAGAGASGHIAACIIADAVVMIDRAHCEYGQDAIVSGLTTPGVGLEVETADLINGSWMVHIMDRFEPLSPSAMHFGYIHQAGSTGVMWDEFHGNKLTAGTLPPGYDIGVGAPDVVTSPTTHIIRNNGQQTYIFQDQNGNEMGRLRTDTSGNLILSALNQIFTRIGGDQSLTCQTQQTATGNTYTCNTTWQYAGTKNMIWRDGSGNAKAQLQITDAPTIVWGVFGAKFSLCTDGVVCASANRFGVINGGGLDVNGKTVAAPFANGTMSVVAESDLTWSASVALVPTSSHNSVTLAGNTTPTLAAGAAGQWFFLDIIENATGGFTWAWPANVANPPAITTTANSINTYTLHWNSQLSKWVVK